MNISSVSDSDPVPASTERSGLLSSKAEEAREAQTDNRAAAVCGSAMGCVSGGFAATIAFFVCGGWLGPALAGTICAGMVGGGCTSVMREDARGTRLNFGLWRPEAANNTPPVASVQVMNDQLRS